MWCLQCLLEAEYKNIWLKSEIVGAQLFSSGLGETQKNVTFNLKADSSLCCDHTKANEKLKASQGFMDCVTLQFNLTFLARCLKSSVLLMRPDLQSGFR